MKGRIERTLMQESDEKIYYRFLQEGKNDDMRELMRRHRETPERELLGKERDYRLYLAIKKLNPDYRLVLG